MTKKKPIEYSWCFLSLWQQRHRDRKFAMWTAKVDFGALAQAISGMNVQLHPPIWILLLVAMSPAHILGLIYLADKVWTLQPEAVEFCRTKASSESQISSQGIFLLPFRHLGLQGDLPVLPIPLTAVGLLTGDLIWLVTLKGRKGGEERGSCAPQVRYVPGVVEESDSVPTTQVNNRTDFPQPLPEWIFAKSKCGECLPWRFPCTCRKPPPVLWQAFKIALLFQALSGSSSVQGSYGTSAAQTLLAFCCYCCPQCWFN